MCEKDKCPIAAAMAGIKDNNTFVVDQTVERSGKCDEHFNQFVEGLQKKGKIVVIYSNPILQQAVSGPTG